MNHIKIISIAIIGILILICFVPQATSAPGENEKFRDKILFLWFKTIATTFGLRYHVMRFSEPQTFIAEPNIIDIKFLNETKIVIGVKDPDTGDFISLQHDTFKIMPLFHSEEYEFKLELPDDIPKGAFIGHFSHQSILYTQDKREGILKTDLQITSNILSNSELPDQIILKLNITKYSTAGNLFRPINGSNPIIWRLFATGVIGHPFGFLYGGKRLIEDVTYVDIIVKLDRFHLIDILPTQNIEIGPDQLVSVPIEVKNLGSHLDTFNFRINSPTDNDLVVIPPSAITLGPNEVAYTSIGIASPQIFNDPGTARKIDIEAFSIYDPDTTFNNSATIITRGVYLSDIGLFYTGGIGIIISIIAVALYILKRRKREIFIKKPEKPWTIYEEKKHLDELKKKDKKEYEKVRLMMEDEYKSAILWYNEHRNSMKEEGKKDLKQKTRKNTVKDKQNKPIKHKFSKFFIKSDKKKSPVKIKKVEKPLEIPDTQKILEISEDERKKEKVLLKIRHEQEKQKQKLKKGSYSPTK